MDTVVAAPGGMRALVTLKPLSRGRHLKIALRHRVFPQAHLDGPGATDRDVSILDLKLEHAPWEETD